MKIIIAYLNGAVGLSRVDLYMLKEKCAALGAEEPFKVSTPEKLTEKLNAVLGEPILLFTNFPPESSYPGSGKSVNMVDKGDYIERSWEADSYSRSSGFFKELLPKYNFKAIHFITGAPENIIQDDFLKSLLRDTPISVTRKNEWIGKGLDYKQLYMNFLMKKIKEALK